MTTCVCTKKNFNALHLDEKLFLLKKSQLTSLFIQHNQSPDTSIFTLYSNNGSKVEKELREKREKDKSVRGKLALLEMENEEGPQEKKGGSMARILGAGEGLRGMGHLWTWAVRDSQGRRGRWSSISMG